MVAPSQILSPLPFLPCARSRVPAFHEGHVRNAKWPQHDRPPAPLFIIKSSISRVNIDKKFPKWRFMQLFFARPANPRILLRRIAVAFDLPAVAEEEASSAPHLQHSGDPSDGRTRDQRNSNSQPLAAEPRRRARAGRDWRAAAARKSAQVAGIDSVSGNCRRTSGRPAPQLSPSSSFIIQKS